MLDELVSSWFSSSRSTESMKRGTSNEDLMMRGIKDLDFVLCFHELGMLGHQSINQITVSPDGLGIIDIAKLDIEVASEDCYFDTKCTPTKDCYAACECIALISLIFA